MPPGAAERAYCGSPRAQYSSRCFRLEPAQEDLTAKFAKDRKERQRQMPRLKLLIPEANPYGARGLQELPMWIDNF
jgi:hypothetical protein